MTALAGGVSSDIWRVDLPGGPVCVKRALPRLKVAALWEAPVERNRYEWAWLQEARRVEPDSVPPLVAHDARGGMLRRWATSIRARASAVEGAAPPRHRAPGDRPRGGAAPGRAPRRRGRPRRGASPLRHRRHLPRHPPGALPRGHRGRRHPDLAPALDALVARTAGTRRTLVHGDVSPKNILIGPRGPIFLDAECAWYGDPAFDLAFCLNHLLLKCLWTPPATGRFLHAFDALAAAYLAGAAWEPRAALERRAAHLLPGLLLARVDGKSPVEYLTAEADRDCVRRTARPLLLAPVDTLGGVRDAWAAVLSSARQR